MPITEVNGTKLSTFQEIKKQITLTLQDKKIQDYIKLIFKAIIIAAVAFITYKAVIFFLASKQLPAAIAFTLVGLFTVWKTASYSSPAIDDKNKKDLKKIESQKNINNESKKNLLEKIESQKKINVEEKNKVEDDDLGGFSTDSGDEDFNINNSSDDEEFGINENKNKEIEEEEEDNPIETKNDNNNIEKSLSDDEQIDGSSNDGDENNQLDKIINSTNTTETNKVEETTSEKIVSLPIPKLPENLQVHLDAYKPLKTLLKALNLEEQLKEKHNNIEKIKKLMKLNKTNNAPKVIEEKAIEKYKLVKFLDAIKLATNNINKIKDDESAKLVQFMNDYYNVIASKLDKYNPAKNDSTTITKEYTAIITDFNSFINDMRDLSVAVEVRLIFSELKKNSRETKEKLKTKDKKVDANHNQKVMTAYLTDIKIAQGKLEKIKHGTAIEKLLTLTEHFNELKSHTYDPKKKDQYDKNKFNVAFENYKKFVLEQAPSKKQVETN